jgi:microcystin-dependent protein
MNKLLATAALSTLGFLCVGPVHAQDQFVGEVRPVGFNFCPRDWLPADGRLLNINQFSALFALYGTIYGGNGQTTFGIPNLQGRAPVAATSEQPIGAVFGNSTVSLTVSNMPPRWPQLHASSAAGAVGDPAGAILGVLPGKDYAAPGSAGDKAMSSNAIGPSGQGVPISTQSPSLSMTWCVATQGIFPQRQ